MNQINAFLSNIYWPLGIWCSQLSKGQICREKDGDAIQILLPRNHHENLKFAGAGGAKDV